MNVPAPAIPPCQRSRHHHREEAVSCNLGQRPSRRNKAARQRQPVCKHRKRALPNRHRPAERAATRARPASGAPGRLSGKPGASWPRKQRRRAPWYRSHPCRLATVAGQTSGAKSAMANSIASSATSTPRTPVCSAKPTAPEHGVRLAGYDGSKAGRATSRGLRRRRKEPLASRRSCYGSRRPQPCCRRQPALTAVRHPMWTFLLISGAGRTHGARPV